MAQQATAEVKYAHGSEHLPIIYEDVCLLVYKNPSGDIFLEDLRSGVTMRVMSCPFSVGLQFTTQGIVEPIPSDDTIAWTVRPR